MIVAETIGIFVDHLIFRVVFVFYIQCMSVFIVCISLAGKRELIIKSICIRIITANNECTHILIQSWIYVYSVCWTLGGADFISKRIFLFIFYMILLIEKIKLILIWFYNISSIFCWIFDFIKLTRNRKRKDIWFYFKRIWFWFRIERKK